MDESVKSGDRWQTEEWRTFELYEKLRVRARRKNFFWITTTILLFLGLCAVPVIEERSPKWKTLRIARDLSVEIEKLKTVAIKNKKPARLTFLESNLFQVDIVPVCDAGIAETETKPEHYVTKQWTSTEGVFKILTPEEAKEFSIALVGASVCFDPVSGLASKYNKQVMVVVSVKDLAEKRLDRASYVIIEGESAKVTLN